MIRCGKCRGRGQRAPVLAAVIVGDHGDVEVRVAARQPSMVSGPMMGIKERAVDLSGARTTFPLARGRSIEVACRSCHARPRARTATLVRQARQALEGPAHYRLVQGERRREEVAYIDG